MRTRTFFPRPEYPRPDRQRGFSQGVDWLNLNGAWEFRFDQDEIGRTQRWFEPGSPRWADQIIVPFCWESLAAWGEADAAGNDHYFSSRVYRNVLEVTPQNHRRAARFEVGWYRRSFVLPKNEHWQDKRVILTIGAADFLTEAWCNGKFLGRHEGGYTPFEFDLTETLARDEADHLGGTLILRVEDRMENAEQPVGKQWGWYTSASGIWQTVYLEPRSRNFIERFEITTDLAAGQARFEIFAQGEGEVSIDVLSPAGQRFDARVPLQEGRAQVSIVLGQLSLWDTNHPQLYSVIFTMKTEGPPDMVQSYFGVRNLSAETIPGSSAPGTLCLSGRPIYLRGALYQSYYPDGVYTAGDTETLRDDIAAAKRAGFDLLRIHIKVDDPLLFYYADTLGILLMCDFPNFGEGGDTPRGRELYEQTMRGAIARDFNHPSIVAWCLFNETWGFGGQAAFVNLINPPTNTPEVSAAPEQGKLSNEAAYGWIQQMWRLAKRLDPTRLVEDMSVVAWEHLRYYGHGETDVNSWHFYNSDYATAREGIRNVVEKTYAGSTFNYVPGFQQGSQPLIASEYGGVGALDGDIDTSWSFKFLTNELRLHGQLSAYIYTELHDVEWERNGFLNYDRTPKEFGYDPCLVNSGDVLPIDAPPLQHCAPGAQVTVNVYSSHFGQRPRENVTLRWVLSGIDSLGWFEDRMLAGEEPIAFPHLRLELAKRLVFRLPSTTHLCTLWVRAFLRDGTLVASNYVQFFADAGSPTTEQTTDRTILRVPPHRWAAAQWSGGMNEGEAAEGKAAASGSGHGFFDFKFPIARRQLASCRRLTILAEASSRRADAAQTDRFTHPTALHILINELPVHRAILPNQPHDARGALSYERGGRGAYGYLCRATVEGDLLRETIARTTGKHLRLRFAVPPHEKEQGGLTIYGYNAGRYPVAPTVLLEAE